MARGSKKKYTGKQKRKAEHIEEVTRSAESARKKPSDGHGPP